jgi:DNA replication protein DnaC
MELKHQLTPQLKHLRLSGVLATLDARNRQAIEGKWSYIEFLSRLLEDEVERRAQKQLQLRLRRAALNTTKTLETFDFQFNPTLNRQQILALATGDYIREHRNVLLCGPTGVGKTHLAEALGQEACRQGCHVLFTNINKMLQHLNGGRADGSWERRLNVYLRPDLLILDDFGLKPLQPPSPEDLYDVINERYERGSILLTSNRAPAEWPDLFRDPLLASAGLDRLLHRAEVVLIRGTSFWNKNKREKQQQHWCIAEPLFRRRSPHSVDSLPGLRACL